MKAPNQFVKRNHLITPPIQVNRNIVNTDKAKALETLNTLKSMKLIKVLEAA